MTGGVVLDTGPIIAFFYPREAYHQWAADQFRLIAGSAQTCETVITESCYLMARRGLDPTRLVDLVVDGTIEIEFELQQEVERIRHLMRKYHDLPMSFADACLVRLAEKTGLPICTLDAHFRVYRGRGNRTLDVIAP